MSRSTAFSFEEPDDRRLLPRFHRRELEHRDRRAVARALAESGERAPLRPGPGMHADPIRLRGIPVVGGASGTSPGTDPLREALRERRR